MSKVTNRPVLSKQKGKKNPLKAKKAAKTVPLSKFLKLKEEYESDKRVFLSQMTFYSEKLDLCTEINKNQSERYDRLRGINQTYHELFIQLRKSASDDTEHFLRFHDNIKELQKNYQNLLINYDPEKIKERLGLINKLGKEIESAIEANKKRKVTVKEIVKSMAEDMRKEEEND